MDAQTRLLRDIGLSYPTLQLLTAQNILTCRDVLLMSNTDLMELLNLTYSQAEGLLNHVASHTAPSYITVSCHFYCRPLIGKDADYEGPRLRLSLFHLSETARTLLLANDGPQVDIAYDDRLLICHCTCLQGRKNLTHQHRILHG